MSDFPESAQMKNNVTEVMNQGMELVDLFVNKNYLIDIDKCEPIPLDPYERHFQQCHFSKLIRLYMT